jgi:hypothetical protein
MRIVIMIIIAIAMSSCCASDNEVLGAKAKLKQEENVKQVMQSAHFENEGEHELALATSSKEFKNESTVQSTCFNVIIFTAILGAVGFAAWKLLPRKD